MFTRPGCRFTSFGRIHDGKKFARKSKSSTLNPWGPSLKGYFIGDGIRLGEGLENAQIFNMDKTPRNWPMTSWKMDDSWMMVKDAQALSGLPEEDRCFDVSCNACHGRPLEDWTHRSGIGQGSLTGWNWLIVSSIFYFPFQKKGCHQSHWRTHSFQDFSRWLNPSTRIYVENSWSFWIYRYWAGMDRIGKSWPRQPIKPSKIGASYSLFLTWESQ